MAVRKRSGRREGPERQRKRRRAACANSIRMRMRQHTHTYEAEGKRRRRRAACANVVTFIQVRGTVAKKKNLARRLAVAAAGAL